jgi:O-antigen/teichoic acid export membrane protein
MTRALTFFFVLLTLIVVTINKNVYVYVCMYVCVYVCMYVMQQYIRTLTQERKTIKPKI